MNRPSNSLRTTDYRHWDEEESHGDEDDALWDFVEWASRMGDNLIANEAQIFLDWATTNQDRTRWYA